MKEKIKIIIIYLTRLLLRLLFIFPLNNNKITFISFGGRAITCNPKYLYNSIYKEYGNKFKYIWLVNNKNNNNDNGKSIHHDVIRID